MDRPRKPRTAKMLAEAQGAAAESPTLHPKQGQRAQARIPTGDIAGRAYELYEQRGRGHGHDYEDWFLAERELKDAVGSTHVSVSNRSR
jgi:DUF2934 family protein